MNSDSMGDEPSFLVFREPSMPRWRRQPVIIPKNLASNLYETETDSFQVFLRIKPNEHGNKTHKVIDSQTIVTIVPDESASSKVLTANNRKKRFSFTSVLQEHTSQKEVFDTCVLPKIEMVLRGEDCLIMTYGTTSAGKTFTMHGTTAEPGIIPRVLSHVFRVLNGSVDGCDFLRPNRNNCLVKLNDDERMAMKKQKGAILALDLAKYQRCNDTSAIAFRTFSGEDFASVDFAQMQQHVGEYATNYKSNADEKTAVWVSMTEIYGENIYDLLTFPSDRGDRPSLSLGEDEQGGFYVKNAQMFCVRTGHEAHQITQFGRSNLHRASTALNNKSSRSHCLLTIVLVSTKANGSATMRRITLADLAGSERVKKTNNFGIRLKESNSINKSLSVLGNCLKVLKENQTHLAQKLVPARDSKLTRLLKNALSGQEKLTFIVNISTDPILFDETQGVLKFSALAQEIVSEKLIQPVRPSMRLSSCQTLGSSLTASMPNLTFQSKSSDTHCEFLAKQLQEARARETELEEEVDKWRHEFNAANNDLIEMSEKAEQLRQLWFTAQQERAIQGQNMSDHLYKVMTEKNQEIDNTAKRLREQHSKEIARMNKEFRELTKAVELENQKKYTMVLQKNKELEKLLAEADEDFDEMTRNSEALIKERNEMAEGVEQLSVEMALLKKSLSEEQLANEQLHEENIALQSQMESHSEELQQLQQHYKLAVKELVEIRTQVKQPACVDTESLIPLLNDASFKIEELKERIHSLEIDFRRSDELSGAMNKLKEENEMLIAELANAGQMSFKIKELKERIKSLEINVQHNDKLMIGDIRKLKEENEMLAAELSTIGLEKVQAERRLQEQLVRVAELESEVEAVRASVKEYSQRESGLVAEKEQLAAALYALEQEALQNQDQIDLLSNQVKILKRSPLKNKTNINVPTARLLEFSPIPMIRFSKSSRFAKSDEDLYSSSMKRRLLVGDSSPAPIQHGKENSPEHPVTMMLPPTSIPKLRRQSDSMDDLPLSVLKATVLKISGSENETMLDPPKDDIEKSSSEMNSSPPPTRSTRKTRKTKNRKKDDKNENSPSALSEDKENDTSPILPKSSRKPRTAKKRDPLDHPALAKNSRGSRRSPSPAPALVPPRSVKKQLFSCDDYNIDLDDDNDFIVPSAVDVRRATRARSRRN